MRKINIKIVRTARKGNCIICKKALPKNHLEFEILSANKSKPVKLDICSNDCEIDIFRILRMLKYVNK